MQKNIWFFTWKPPFNSCFGCGFNSLDGVSVDESATGWTRHSWKYSLLELFYINSNATEFEIYMIHTWDISEVLEMFVDLETIQWWTVENFF